MRYEEALAIAMVAHDGMVDKAGAPYIDHPVRVAAAVDGNSDKVVAVLHDVLEDCGMSIKHGVFAGLSMAERDALVAISKLPEEKGLNYWKYLKRVAANPIARRVKLADLEDNLDVSRFGRELDEVEKKRVEKYVCAKLFLESVDY